MLSRIAKLAHAFFFQVLSIWPYPRAFARDGGMEIPSVLSNSSRRLRSRIGASLGDSARDLPLMFAALSAMPGLSMCPIIGLACAPKGTRRGAFTFLGCMSSRRCSSSMPIRGARRAAAVQYRTAPECSEKSAIYAQKMGVKGGGARGFLSRFERPVPNQSGHDGRFISDVRHVIPPAGRLRPFFA